MKWDTGTGVYSCQLYSGSYVFTTYIYGIYIINVSTIYLTNTKKSVFVDIPS